MTVYMTWLIKLVAFGMLVTLKWLNLNVINMLAKPTMIYYNFWHGAKIIRNTL